MNENYYTTPVSLRKVRITDSFWKNEMELVREEILPYQWDALNDQVEGGAQFLHAQFPGGGETE